ncbi:MAG: hypothetical protein QOD29_58 [Alphaproteobacteria bacterium]|jgi:hypothetical protein|nr:hypothetical protein [Alphaproteobacteria bacterium]
MKCEPITALGLAMAVTRTGLRARITFLALTARRTRAMPLFAALARAVVRAGFARRTIFRTGRLPFSAVRFAATLRFATVLRFAAMLRFAVAVRFAAMLRFAVAVRFAAMLRLAVAVRFAAMLRFAVAVRFAAVVRFAAMLRFAVVVRFTAAVFRAGFARRTVFLTVVFPLTARRVREGVFFAVRARDVLDLLNITTYPTLVEGGPTLATLG